MLTLALITMIAFSSFSILWFSNKPINSVFSLILVYGLVSILLISLNVEFLGLLLVIVYVGAIAILFLFAVMMLGGGHTLKKKNSFSFFDICFFFFGVKLLFFVKNLSFWSKSFFFYNNLDAFLDWSFIVDSNNSLRFLGNVIYTDYAFLFILTAFYLLVTMVGSLALSIGQKQ